MLNDPDDFMKKLLKHYETVEISKQHQKLLMELAGFIEWTAVTFSEDKFLFRVPNYLGALRVAYSIGRMSIQVDKEFNV